MNDTGMAKQNSSTSEVFETLFLVLTGNSLGGCQSWSCRKWRKGQRRLFFFFSFLLLLSQSCLSFPSSFDSFLPISEKKTTLSDANALHVGGFSLFSLSNRCCCRRRRLYRLKRSGAYMSSALLSVDLCPSLSSSSSSSWIQQETASNIT